MVGDPGPAASARMLRCLATGDALLEICLFGPLRVERAGRVVAISGDRRRAVLVHLVLERGRSLSTARLIDDIWGEHAPSSAANALQVHVGYLRRQLGSRCIVTEGRAYRLDADAVRVDIEEFEVDLEQARAALASGENATAAARAGAALARCCGPPLVDVAGSARASSEISRLDELHGATIELRFEALAACGAFGDVVAEAEAAIIAHPWREPLWRELITALAHQGRTAEAGRTFQRYRRLLADEIGLEPSVDLVELVRAVVGGTFTSHAARPHRSARHHDGGAPRTRLGAMQERLPGSHSPFIGRVEEIAELERAVRSPGVVSVVGAGGFGKTRLGIEVARRSSGRWADGAWFVALAPICDSALVPLAVAQSLGLAVVGEATAGPVALGLRGFRALIVLDNCEHVSDGAADFVAELLVTAPTLSVLVTSRQPLGVVGERVHLIRPLDAGPIGSGGALDLFAARVAESGEPLAPSEHGTAAKICEQLDGMPLAIELAAARVRALGAAEVLASLDARLANLSGDRRHEERHRTLRSTVQWSYELLDERQRRGFVALSAFSGTFDLDAAHAVLAAVELSDAESSQLLVELVDKSMVEATRDDRGRRYRLLETLRQYGVELLTAELATAVRRAHARHYAERIAAWREVLHGPRERDAVDEFDANLDNVRAAFEWCLANAEPDLAIRVAEPAVELTYGYQRGNCEPFDWVEAVLPLAVSSMHPSALGVVAGSALGRWLHDDISGGLRAAELGRDLALRLGRPLPSMLVHSHSLLVAYTDRTGAVEMMSAGLDEARARGDRYWAAYHSWTRVATQGWGRADHDLEDLAREAVVAATVSEHPSHRAAALLTLATTIAWKDPRAARQALDEAMVHAEAARVVWTIRRINVARAELDIREAAGSKTVAAARALARLFDEDGSSNDIAARWQMLVDAAALVLHRSSEDVATLFGVFEARDLGGQGQAWVIGVDAVRHEIGEDRFRRCMARGAHFATDEVFAFVTTTSS